MWEVQRLEEHFCVTVFDNRGCGRTGLLNGICTIRRMADDTAALCKAIGIERAKFVGHSMGGHIVQHLGVYYPELVDALVIACSEAKFSIVSELATSQQIALMKFDLPRRLLAENYFPLLFGRSFLEDSSKRDAYLQNLMSKPPAISPQGYELQVAALRNHDTREILHKITAPTLVLGAEEDLLTPWQNSVELAKKIPAARLVRLDGLGHAAFAEDPDAFYAAILAFLRS